MKPLALLLSLSVIMWSCEPCGNLDCIPSYDTFQFSYLSESKEDLLDGPAKKFKFKDIELYSIDENGNKTMLFHTFTPRNSPVPSYLEVHVRYGDERCFFEINGVVRDTLDFKFSNRITRCCGKVSTIAETILNGVVYTGDQPAALVERN